MATYSSDNITLKKPISGADSGGGVISAYAAVTCAAAPTTTDTIEFFYLPANARILAATLESTDMDTNGAPTLTINVGDAGSATRLFSASTVGQAGTASVASAVAGLHYKTTAKTKIVGTAANNAASGAAGTLYLSILYTVE
ncbi:MAG: hypothetical protein KGM99_05620 [Burkholderiales bacterium]|nr:hypothetical protein [Burkholderiales bacterium]